MKVSRVTPENARFSFPEATWASSVSRVARKNCLRQVRTCLSKVRGRMLLEVVHVSVVLAPLVWVEELVGFRAWVPV